MEILAANLEQALKDLHIKATKTYQRIKEDYIEKYQVWELSDSEFKKLDDVKEEDWKDEWGWWRSAEGSNITDQPIIKAKINDEPIKAYFDLDSYTDYIVDLFEPDEPGNPYYLKEDYFEDKINVASFTQYCSECWGAGLPKNVCAIAIETAKLNHIKLSELFKKYEG